MYKQIFSGMFSTGEGIPISALKQTLTENNTILLDVGEKDEFIQWSYTTGEKYAIKPNLILSKVIKIHIMLSSVNQVCAVSVRQIFSRNKAIKQLTFRVV